MSEQLTKLRPDRDLQCYFQQPSAIAAMSGTSANGFTVSGCWRDPFDWAVIEWNRDNAFEHPLLRNLPDGDLSQLCLSYKEARTNCIAMDSSLYPTVEWPFLRIWSDQNGIAALYDVPLHDSRLGYATPSDGAFGSATVTFELQGTITGGDYIELAWLDQHFNYLLIGMDTLTTGVSQLTTAVNKFGDGTVSASSNGPQITLSYAPAYGANANRIGVYGTVHGAGTESWLQSWGNFAGGTSPQQWQVALNFSALQGYVDPDRTRLVPVPTTSVRKMRWTWAAAQQAGNYQRSEFSAVVTDWSVSGSNLTYKVAGPGSRRIEDDSTGLFYSPVANWNQGSGNFSGGSIHWTITRGARVTCSYTNPANHTLYLGTRFTGNGANISVQVDGGTPISIDLKLANEDILVRIPIGTLAGGNVHQIVITHAGSTGSFLYFDFLEIAIPTADLPDFPVSPSVTLATDWDTYHSLALAPERTAWIVQKLGFRGRANHYAGALWFYELCRPDQQFASAAIEFCGNPEWGKVATVNLGGTILQHVNLIGETTESLTRCFALLINAGSNSVWGAAEGAVLTITSRSIGSTGNGFAIGATADNSAANPIPLTAQVSSSELAGGIDGTHADPNGNYWRTDLSAVPRMNRAARDWSASFFAALKGYGIDGAASFSMELQHGDDSTRAGIAQRYPNGDPAWLTTPALQTNFSPTSLAFWQQVYADMAGLMADLGMAPYLQFGEVQWWYFPGQTATVVTEPGLPLYDAYTKQAFQTATGRAMGVIQSQYTDATAFSVECTFLAGQIGVFTKAIRDFVRASFPDSRFEVLYPVDVNDTPLNRALNFACADWTPANLACLKTESFTYTFERDLNKAAGSIQLPAQYGFPPSQRSHLVGINDCTTPWRKEQQLAVGAKLESVVLFALDQFCLIGYSLPLGPATRRSGFMGA